MIPDPTTFDLTASYVFHVAGREVTAQVNAKNLLDRRCFSDVQAAFGPFGIAGAYSAATALYGDPRTVLGSLKVAS